MSLKFIFYGDCMDYYKQIFKRKSFHLFRDTGMITDQDIRELEEFIGTVKPLYAEIKTEVRILYYRLITNINRKKEIW